MGSAVDKQKYIEKFKKFCPLIKEKNLSRKIINEYKKYYERYQIKTRKF